MISSRISAVVGAIAALVVATVTIIESRLVTGSVAAQEPAAAVAPATAQEPAAAVAPAPALATEQVPRIPVILNAATVLTNFITALFVSGEIDEETAAQVNVAARDLDQRLEDLEGDVDDIRQQMSQMREQLNRMDERLNMILERLP